MAPAAAPDVLLVSLGSTTGLRAADDELAASLRRAGASVAVARARPPRQLRTLMLTDLAWARAARAAAAPQLAPAGGAEPRAVIYSTTTAALLWQRPGAIRFDAPAAANRPGRHGLWQRPLEQLRLRQAPLLLPLSRGGLAELPGAVAADRRALVVPVPVEPSGPPAPARDIAAITYAGNPAKKGLDRVLEAWDRVRISGASAELELVVAGATPEELRRSGIELDSRPGVRSVGPLGAVEYRALLRRARVFICAPRREDYGAAQLEALADGCLLVSTPAPGPYAALPLALELDGRLIDEDLPGALALALAYPDPAVYAARAGELLAPYSPAAVDRLIATELVPRLIGASADPS
ncbi:MAG: glycosyltransferase [Solirubrobacteraceae bacterium]